ncbi:hypothetical protein CLOM_g8492 [Closterium sp. NIES-68]|nr:hypothetical protein CLOM_g8492 [Closterium sp. NIES-68]GJP78344.1 hypothetical protein CLOP_g8661 [Closterium sp. NIES-67]
MVRERVQRALSLAWCLAALAVAPFAMIHAVPLQASQVKFLQDCQTAWDVVFPGWSGSNPDCRRAENVKCDSSGMIVEINILWIDLRGPIPDSIGNLRKLTALYLVQSHLSGSIPTTIGILTNLVNM